MIRIINVGDLTLEVGGWKLEVRHRKLEVVKHQTTNSKPIVLRSFSVEVNNK
jgi:hypothetical protein